ncbi:hypothetical protein F4861DRAFT_276773 [Xylaria intraflava]|nr:hypothetical protein F4861DRAFT_276773 [Xylaria intraflava]
MDSMSPLPRRRSCDRCYAQKVRCIQTQDSQVTNSDDPSDTLPCLRCVKSGKQCSYSPQRKPGRPSVSQIRASPESTEQSREDNNALMPTFPIPPDPQSPVFVADDNEIDPNVGLDVFEPLSPWLVHHDSFGLNPTTEVPSEEGKLLSECMNEFLEAGNTFDGSSINVTEAIVASDQEVPDTLSGSGIDTCSPGEPHMASFGQPQGLGFLDHEFGIFEQRNGPTYPPSPPGAAIRGLSELSLRINRSTQLLSTRAFDAPLSTNSPLIDNFFGVTNSLVHIIDGIASPAPGSNSESNDYWEVGVALLVLSCHQQLLAAFEQVYAKIHHRLVREKSSFTRHPIWATSNSHENGITHSDLYDRRTLSSSTIAQSVMVVKLLKHLIRRLDNALAPIANCPRLQIPPENGSGRRAKPGAPLALSLSTNLHPHSSALPSGSTSSPGVPSTDKDPNGVEDRGTELHLGDNEKEAETSLPTTHADTATARFVLDAMSGRRDRLKVRIREVKALIRSMNMP